VPSHQEASADFEFELGPEACRLEGAHQTQSDVPLQRHVDQPTDDAWGCGHLVERNVALNIDGKVYDPTDPMGTMFIGFLAGADHAGCRWFPRASLP